MAWWKKILLSLSVFAIRLRKIHRGSHPGTPVDVTTQSWCHNTILMSTGTPVKYCNGVSLASTHACHLSKNHPFLVLDPPNRNLPLSLSIQPPSKTLKWRTRVRSLWSTGHSRMSSASGWQPNFLLISHGTVQSTCYLGLLCPKAEFTHCPSRSRRPWRSTFRRHSNNTSFDHLHPLPLRVSSSWQKRMEACGCASTTVISTPKRWSIGTHFLWSRQLWNSYGELASSPSWTCEAHTTSFVYAREMSGRPPSLHHLGTNMNIGLCRMAYPTLPLSSKAIWMRCSGSSFNNSSSSTSTISSSTPGTCPNIVSTSCRSSRSSAITSLSQAGEVRVPHHLRALSGLCHWPTWNPDGPEEGGSDPELASTSYCQGTTTFPRICKFLPKVYPQLQPAQFTSHILTQGPAQVSVLELTCPWRLPSTPRSLPDRSDPGSSQPRSPVHRRGGRLFHRGRSGTFAYVPSRSYVSATGGPPWLRISLSTSKDARSVPSQTLQNFQKENWFLCPFQTVRGPIWASTSWLTSHALIIIRVFVVVDRFSKACKLLPLKGLPTAFEAAEALFQNVFHHFGLPEDIVLDRGPQFVSRVWQAFFKLMGVSLSLSSGYHPQTNSQTEQKVQEIRRYLRSYCHQNQDTPFQCILGYQPPLFPWLGEPSEVPAVKDWLQQSERVWDSAHVHLQQAVRRHKRQADTRKTPTPHYQPGQKLWLSTRDICLRLPCGKLSPRYIGPFTVQRQLNEVTYRLTLPPHYRILPSFHVSHLKPHSEHLLSSPTESGGDEVPPPPEIADEETIYRVRAILDSRRQGPRLEYLIDWEDYGPEEHSWVAFLTSSIQRSSHNTTLNTQIAQLQGVKVDPVVSAPSGRQEPTMEEGVLSRSHNHHRLIATYRHQISTLHPLGHFPQSSDSRHLHLISTVTIKSHLSCETSGLVHTNSTDSLPDTNHHLGTLPVFCHPGTIFYPSSASRLFLCKRDIPITIS